LPVISNQSCSSELRYNLPGSVICGGGAGGVSACNGDSGGPFAASTGGKFYSIGTVSWGNGCVGATVFTRTSSYLSWIEQKTGIKPDSDNPVDQKPVARFTAAINGLNVNFTDGSTDDKGIRSWSWDFGDGSATVSQSSPSYSYSADGSYTVTLTVTDTIGQTGTSSQLVQVKANGDPTGCDGIAAWSPTQSYQLRDIVSYLNKKYQASWWSTGARPDIYSNVWTALGDCSASGNTAPVAGFSFQTNKLAVSFSDQSTDDQAVVSWLWSFGNGSSSTQASPTITYAVAGSYPVQLTVKDAQGLSHSVTKTVTVSSDDTGSGCAGLALWSNTAVYNAGGSVQRNGNKYRARWWTQGQDPISNAGPWQVWELLGSCQP
jgi:PKD repeat protein